MSITVVLAALLEYKSDCSTFAKSILVSYYTVNVLPCPVLNLLCIVVLSNHDR